jgi:hypothetical protein
MINIRVERKRASYDFRVDPHKPDSFENNWKNNSLDSIIICDDNVPLVRFHCQTVANYCFGAMKTATTVLHGDTIAPGSFIMKAFVEPRAFHGEIHAITRTRDIDGEWIDHEAMQTTLGGFQNGRFLVHDKFSFKSGADSTYAWSAGCFIQSSRDLEQFNKTLRAAGVKPGDLIQGLLVEE